jgi:hypothetical protein
MGGQGARIHIDIYVGQGAEERTKYPRSLVPYKALYHARLHTLVPCRPTASRATTPPIAPRNATAADTRRPFRCSRPHKIAVLRSISCPRVIERPSQQRLFPQCPLSVHSASRSDRKSPPPPLRGRRCEPSRQAQHTNAYLRGVSIRQEDFLTARHQKISSTSSAYTHTNFDVVAR